MAHYMTPEHSGAFQMGNRTFCHLFHIFFTNEPILANEGSK